MSTEHTNGHHCHDPRHIEELEKKINRVSEALAHLGRGESLQELLIVIHRPGWTSIAEFGFVNSILDNVGAQVRTLEHELAELLAVSKKVQASN